MEKTGGSIFLKILKILATLLLTFIFIITAFVLPLYYTVAGIFTPKTVATVVQNIDYVEIIEKSPEFKAAMNDLGIDISVANEIMQSDEIGDFVGNCAGSVLDIVITDPKNLASFDPLVMKDIIDEHIDEISDVLNEKLEKPIKKEDIHSTMNKLLEENSDAIKQALIDLAPADNVINPYQKIMSTIKTTLSWPFITGVILAEALLLGLIYLLNKKKFGGFIWITVNAVIVAILLTVVFILCKSNLVSAVFTSALGFLAGVGATMLGTITAKLLIAIITLAVIAVGSIIAFILLKKNSTKKASEELIEQAVVQDDNLETEELTE